MTNGKLKAIELAYALFHRKWNLNCLDEPELSVGLNENTFALVAEFSIFIIFWSCGLALVSLSLC